MDEENNDNIEYLFEAIETGNLGRVEDLVFVAKVDVNSTNQFENNNTPLHKAADFSRKQIVRFLLVRGGIPNLKNDDGNTVLHMAAYHNNVDIVRDLINYNAYVNMENNQGDTPLFIAVKYNNLDVMRYLIRSGSNINHKNYVGQTPLHIAAIHSRSEASKFLLENGADETIMDQFNQTPLEIAQMNTRNNMLEAIVKRNKLGIMKENISKQAIREVYEKQTRLPPSIRTNLGDFMGVKYSPKEERKTPKFISGGRSKKTREKRHKQGRNSDKKSRKHTQKSRKHTQKTQK